VKVIRYPNTTDCSLKAWSAADELLLGQVLDQNLSGKKIITYNDRFGYLNCQLHQSDVLSVISYKSQEKSHKINLKNNGFKFDDSQFINPLSSIEEKVDIALMKVPKSVNLFELYLAQIATCIRDEGVVYCSFMTRHFTKQLLSISNKYFEVVEQSLAKKKARVLILKKKKEVNEDELINKLNLSDNEFLRQYYGVFSAKEIDQATQFFIDNLQIDESTKEVLDLAAGNGVLGYIIQKQLTNCRIHLIDDFYLAVESAKLNLKGEDVYFHYNDTLKEIEENSIDLVVSNPPFHFEYETNIEISLSLFKDVTYCLKQGGKFQLVANRHINYGPHLERIFNKVIRVVHNDKFEIYNCIK
jgi:16S rRNA G1207 methylase RsmC